MTPRFLYFLASEGVSVDQLTHRLTAFNIIDAVHVAAVPSLIVRLVAVSSYELGDAAAEFEERVSFFGPDSEEPLAASQSSISFQPRTAPLPCTHNSLHAFWALQLSVAGDYRLVLERRAPSGTWETLSVRRVTVAVNPNPIANAPSVAGTRTPVPEGPPSTPPTER